MDLDEGLYASRLLDWLYEKQASPVRRRQANDEAAKESLREQYPGESEQVIHGLFEMWYGSDVAGETEASQGYVEIRAFLEPLGVNSRAAYHIVNYAVERDWLTASENEPLGRDWGGTLLATSLDDGVPRFAVYYDRVLITEVGIRVAESSRPGWREIMPRAAPLAQRLLVWLSNEGDPAGAPAYLPNFLASGHACFRGRPLFTAALLGATVRRLLTIGLLEDCKDDSPGGGAGEVRLTRRGLDCATLFHGDVESYLAQAVNHGQRGDGNRRHALAFGSVNERGWGWTASEIRRIRLLSWIAEQSGGHPERYVEIKAFYDARSDQGENDTGVAAGDLAYLAEVRLIMDGSGIGGIESMAAMLTPQGHDLLEQLHARREHKIQRRTACRDAMVAWLYAADAMDAMRRVDRTAMLHDPRHGIWLAGPFGLDDLAEAAAWLHERRLVDGPTADQTIGPLQLYLTGPGITCAEHFDSDTRRYQEERMGRRSGPTANIGNNYGPVQMAGDHASQVQQVNASAEHLRELITSIAELVRLASPDVSDLDAQRTAALTAATDGAVDRPALKRFADWALAVVGKGASAAMSPAVTAATNDLLREAERLAGHL